MLKRILTAAVALAILIPILLFAPSLAVQGVFSLLTVLAFFEIAGVTGVRKEHGFWIPIAVFLVLGQEFAGGLIGLAGEALDRQTLSEYGLGGVYGIAASPLLCALVFVAVYVVVRNGKLDAVNALAFFAMALYAAAGFDALESFCGSGSGGSVGEIFGERLLLWIALSVPWAADTLAYFAGRFFGKKKLCPDISPKKTVAGAVGGVAGTGVIYALLFGIFGEWAPLSLLAVLLGSMALAAASIFGDLFASVIKRHFGVKDYGNLFPGHGGVMDRFDSTIPVALLLGIAAFGRAL